MCKNLSLVLEDFVPEVPGYCEENQHRDQYIGAICNPFT